MNKRYNDLIKQGYSYTGITSRGSWDKDEVVVRMNAQYKVMGNKVAVAQKVDVSPRRGGGEDKHYYWVGLVLKSDTYKAFEQAEHEKRIKEQRERDLRHLIEGLTLAELSHMIRLKVDETVKSYDGYHVDQEVVATATTSDLKEGTHYFIMKVEVKTEGFWFILRPVDYPSTQFPVKVLGTADFKAA